MLLVLLIVADKIAFVKWINRTDSARNIMVILHAFGDSEAPFVAFASSMKLPDTACVCARAPMPVPMEDGLI